MLENIALIKEVHELLPRAEAEALANSYLQKIDLSNIGTNRLNQCNSIEIFYCMFIRALMCKESNVIILTPFYLIDNLEDIHSVIEKIDILNDNKNILILDSIKNEIQYEGSLCHIVK